MLTGIIDEMFKRMHPDSIPVDDVTKKWCGWADTTLLPVLQRNVYGSLSGALKASDYILSHGCYEDSERFVLKHSHAWYMYFVVNKWKIKHYFLLKKKWKVYKVNNDREFLYKAAEEWVDALKGRLYLGLCYWRPYVTTSESGKKILSEATRVIGENGCTVRNGEGMKD
ncbi:Glutaredoxin [Artemisia annua]|uniref:Glutaredoxin n=1 Tax=Artemisia annua TaxID=35608 RepID=A0A2U1PSK2_ARTAN|nr:Glutaredoxin [Artemisia annua]